MQPHPQNGDISVQPQPLPNSGNIQPCPPSGEPPPRRRRSGDIRIRSGDPYSRSDQNLNKSKPTDNNVRTRSGDARVRSHDQIYDAKTQHKSPLTVSAPSIEQQVTPRNNCSEITSHLTSQSDSHMLQCDCDDLHNPATPTVANIKPSKFSWDKQITPILNTINSASKSDTEMVCELCANLWTALQLSNMIGCTGKSKQRSSVLRAMFQLLDSKDSRLLLRATKIILAVSLLICYHLQI